MRFVKLLLAISVVAVMVFVGSLTGASRRTRSANQAQAALLEFHDQWTTNGNDVVFSRNRWPASIKALQVNGVEVNRFMVGVSKREDGPLGIWWSKGYQIHRQNTNDDVWTLYRVYSLGVPKIKEFRWRSVLTELTNAP